MNIEFPDPDRPLDDEWIAPLTLVSSSVRNNPRYQFFDVGDFMVMGRSVRKSRPDITIYKHYFTRSPLHLDAAGTAYRYIPPKDFERGDGRYVKHKSIEAALDDVGTWELPWLKPGLELYRFGIDWDQRWLLHPRSDPRRFLLDAQQPWGFGSLAAEDWCPQPPPTATTTQPRGDSPRAEGHLRLVPARDNA